MTELSGRRSRELKSLRHFQIRDSAYIRHRHSVCSMSMYKAWSCSQRERNIKDQRRTSERIRERPRGGEEETFTSLCRQPWLCHRHLESLVCSSMNFATESTVGLCETPRTLSSLPWHATTLLWTIFRNLQNLQNLRTFGLYWPVRLRTSKLTMTLPCVVSQSKL